jgi:predicted NUDIX family phosphoesterase
MALDKSAERVLVIPTGVLREAGIFHGFTDRVDFYLPRLLRAEHMRFLARAEAELDPEFKQIVPYVVLKCGKRVFHYTRGKRATETRLQALRSVGVGGHISATDSNLFDAPYREAMFREVAEEVALESPFEEKCIGLINDDSTPVGQVHLGIVHVFELEQPTVRRREQALTRSGFAELGELHSEVDQFETWSQFVLQVLIARDGKQVV